MKQITLRAAQATSLFGVVTLKPGVNEISQEAWDAVKELRLGHNTVPYVQWARTHNILAFEDDPAPAQACASEAGGEALSAPLTSDAVPPASDSPAAPKKRGRPPKGP